MKPVRKFDKFYRDVPAEQREALRRFRGRYLQAHATVGGTRWAYRRIGYEGKPLLWLVGGLRVADSAFMALPMMGETYDIIAPDYPALGDMDALADGLAGLLDELGMERVAVLCGSFGGMLGQVFVRRHPHRVGQLILSSTTAPDGELRGRYEEQLGMIGAVDDESLAQVAQRTLYDAMQPPAHESALWRAFLAELYEERLTRADIIATYEALIDYMRRDFFVDDLEDWRRDGGEMLIITSDDDGTFGASQQGRLLGLYPFARHYSFEGAGHSPSSTQREAYFRLVRQFLDTDSDSDEVM